MPRHLIRFALPVLALLLATPGISAAQARNRDAGDDSGSSSQAVPRGSVPPPAPAPAPPAPTAAPPSPPPALTPSAPDSAAAGRRGAPRSATPSDASSGESSQGARPRGGRATAGTAVPRGSVPPPPRPSNPSVRGPVYYGSYWPWGFGGLGFASYYGGYYGGFYDPYAWYGGYGGYGGYGVYGGGYPASSYTFGFEGSLRLKIKPRDAQVFVDGYYVGVVNDFDGVFQRLHIEAGPHRIEVRAPGYEPLTFDVRVRYDETTNLEGELQRLP